MADKISPEAVQILQRLGHIRKQVQELIQPLRFQLTYQELCRLRLEGIITNTEFHLLTNPLFDPLAWCPNPGNVWSVWHLAPIMPRWGVVVNLVMPPVPTNADSNVRPSHVLAANKSFPFPSLKSSILNNGKKTLSLWSRSRKFGKTILYGMAFVMKTTTRASKDSWENSKIRMIPTARHSTFWVTPKVKSFHAWKPVWASCKPWCPHWTLDSFFSHLL